MVVEEKEELYTDIQNSDGLYASYFYYIIKTHT